jgi:hypothetical protein
MYWSAGAKIGHDWRGNTTDKYVLVIMTALLLIWGHGGRGRFTELLDFSQTYENSHTVKTFTHKNTVITYVKLFYLQREEKQFKFAACSNELHTSFFFSVFTSCIILVHVFKILVCNFKIIG